MPRGKPKGSKVSDRPWKLLNIKRPIRRIKKRHYKKTCLRCNKTFHANSSNQLYCVSCYSERARELRRERARELGSDPKYRARVRERQREYWCDPKNCERQRELRCERMRSELQFGLMKFIRVAEKLLNEK